MHEGITHDAAWATASSIMDCLKDCFLEAERADAFTEIYCRVKAGIEAAFVYSDRRQHRREPGRN